MLYMWGYDKAFGIQPHGSGCVKPITARRSLSFHCYQTKLFDMANWTRTIKLSSST